MKILSPNVHSQTRPEKIECFEGFDGVLAFKRCLNSAKQSVELPVILS